MGRKKILEIKEWLGSGTGDLKLEIESYMFIERNFGSRKIQKLVIERKPDRYSSRFGMMANLNKNNNTLSWGFNQMSLTVEETSDTGAFISVKTYDFISIGVENSRMKSDEEEITFVFSKKSEFAISNVFVTP